MADRTQYSRSFALPESSYLSVAVLSPYPVISNEETTVDGQAQREAPSSSRSQLGGKRDAGNVRNEEREVGIGAKLIACLDMRRQTKAVEVPKL